MVRPSEGMARASWLVVVGVLGSACTAAGPVALAPLAATQPAPAAAASRPTVASEVGLRETLDASGPVTAPTPPPAAPDGFRVPALATAGRSRRRSSSFPDSSNEPRPRSRTRGEARQRIGKRRCDRPRKRTRCGRAWRPSCAQRRSLRGHRKIPSRDDGEATIERALRGVAWAVERPEVPLSAGSAVRAVAHLRTAPGRVLPYRDAVPSGLARGRVRRARLQVAGKRRRRGPRSGERLSRCGGRARTAGERHERAARELGARGRRSVRAGCEGGGARLLARSDARGQACVRSQDRRWELELRGREVSPDGVRVSRRRAVRGMGGGTAQRRPSSQARGRYESLEMPANESGRAARPAAFAVAVARPGLPGLDATSRGHSIALGRAERRARLVARAPGSRFHASARTPHLLPFHSPRSRRSRGCPPPGSRPPSPPRSSRPAPTGSAQAWRRGWCSSRASSARPRRHR